MYGRGRFFRGGRGNFRGGFQQNARWGAQGTVKAQNLQVLSKAQKNKERYVEKKTSEDYKWPRICAKMTGFYFGVFWLSDAQVFLLL